MFSPSVLFKAPETNSINKKAKSIPALNPIDPYGRVFFFSWFGFLLAFWSWYAFPPLLHDIISSDLDLTNVEVSNSNIIALTATFIVRIVAGPCCDRFGPRWTFAGCLLIGSIPTFLSGAAYTVGQLYALRFFIGILGGSFVPCQVWTTAFYDKNIVGTANSLTAGLGNVGGGITYFVMPAVYTSLVGDGVSTHVAWRVAFVVPGILITAVAIGMLLLCPDNPTGKWSERKQAFETILRQYHVQGSIIDVPSQVEGKPASGTSTSPEAPLSEEEKAHQTSIEDHDAQRGNQQLLDIVRGEIVQEPSFAEIVKVSASPQTIVCGAVYFCSFGAELAINSVLGTYYHANFGKAVGLQTASNWAAMFGLMNALFRSLGGLVSDIVYGWTGSLWSKKIVLHTYVVIAGAFLLAIGFVDPHDIATMVCLVGIGFAFFLEGANGLTFGLVPHVHPYANGIVSGFTGACGNLGGIIFAIVLRYNYTNYGRSMWIIGVVMIAIQVAICWIKPVGKGQVGGRWNGRVQSV